MGKRGPAPKGEYSGQTAVLSTRITPDLRAQLEAEVKKSGKTLSREIEHRLRRSFIEDEKISEAFGSRQVYALMKMISMIIQTWHNPLQFEKDWRSDPLSYDQMCKKISYALKAMRPEGPVAPLSDLEKATLELDASQKPLILIDALQRASETIPINGSQTERTKALMRSDLGQMIDRPNLFFGTAKQIRERIAEIEATESKGNNLKEGEGPGK
ncbi:MAG: hypothetical protein WAP03_18255 [Methylorubrum rhodinum]|uniref:hypothetical protein n=1 Tax=Methylorubrum rhodinum TaxID=29428 RepID=UPI003BAF2F27